MSDVLLNDCAMGRHPDCPEVVDTLAICICACHVEPDARTRRIPMPEHGRGLKHLQNKREEERDGQ